MKKRKKTSSPQEKQDHHKGSSDYDRTKQQVSDAIDSFREEGLTRGVDIVKALEEDIHRLYAGKETGKEDLKELTRGAVCGLFATSRVVQREARQTMDMLAEFIVENVSGWDKKSVNRIAQGFVEGMIEIAEPAELNTAAAASEGATCVIQHLKQKDTNLGKEVEGVLTGEILGIEVKPYEFEDIENIDARKPVHETAHS